MKRYEKITFFQKEFPLYEVEFRPIGHVVIRKHNDKYVSTYTLDSYIEVLQNHLNFAKEYKETIVDNN